MEEEINDKPITKNQNKKLIKKARCFACRA